MPRDGGFACIFGSIFGFAGISVIPHTMTGLASGAGTSCIVALLNGMAGNGRAGGCLATGLGPGFREAAQPLRGGPTPTERTRR